MQREGLGRRWVSPGDAWCCRSRRPEARWPDRLLLTVSAIPEAASVPHRDCFHCWGGSLSSGGEPAQTLRVKVHRVSPGHLSGGRASRSGGPECPPTPTSPDHGVHEMHSRPAKSPGLVPEAADGGDLGGIWS